jgi:hypothetical protein
MEMEETQGKTAWILFHSADFDGHCSGAIVNSAIKKMHQKIELKPINYGQKVPSKIKDGDFVYIVDFSFPMDEMIALNERVMLLWIDHHKSAIDDYHKEILNEGKTPINGYLIDGKSACELAWEYFYESKIPYGITLLGIYDTWRKEESPLDFPQDLNFWEDQVIPFQYGLKLIEDTRPHKNMEIWEKVFESSPDFINETVKLGRTLLKYDYVQNRISCSSYSFTALFEGYTAIVINRIGGSMLFDSVWDESKYDIMIPYSYNGNHYKFSLYTTNPNIDVSVLAKRYQGGGHRGAAGFEWYRDEMPFIQIGMKKGELNCGYINEMHDKRYGLNEDCSTHISGFCLNTETNRFDILHENDGINFQCSAAKFLNDIEEDVHNKLWEVPATNKFLSDDYQGIYKHYKGTSYRVIDCSWNIEYFKWMIIYMSLDYDIIQLFSRPYEEFFETLIIDDNNEISRFKKISD